MAAGPEVLRLAEALLASAREVSSAAAAGGLPRPHRADRVSLARKISLLVHLFEEIRDSAAAAARGGGSPPAATTSLGGGAPSPASYLADLLLAVEAARRFLSQGCLQEGAPPGNAAAAALETMGKSTALQLQYVTWQLEKVLGSIQYDYFDISDEVQEQVALVQTQLKRVTERNGPPNLDMFSEIYNIIYRTHSKEVIRQVSDRTEVSQTKDTRQSDCDTQKIVVLVAEANSKSTNDAEQTIASVLENLNSKPDDGCKVTEDGDKSNSSASSLEEVKKSDALVIPEDFRCPISLELMRDPVIVSTGQTYERSFIQRWIDCGNHTCPKTQQKLPNLTLTPNYVLRSLIMQWCQANNIEQPHRANGRIRKSDGSYQDVYGDRAAIDGLVQKLSIGSLDEQRTAAAEIRLLAKRSTDNRILIAEAGAVPFLIGLLSVNDLKTQEHAVTSLLNLSIYENNKGLIMLSGAISPIIHVLRMGNMEARENAAAAIFSLSLIDENKIIIGSTPGAFEALVDLLQNGSFRGKKDAATALFNLCIYQGNKPRAVRAGILMPLMKMLTDVSSNCMVDEALTILSVIVSHQEGKVAIAKANMIPVLLHLLRTEQPRHKENAAAILLALCKKDSDNLAYIGRLGAVGPLSELAKSGTDRAKRKATSLLEHLNRLHRH
ncbi:hypothetical protein Taro_042205 [Colocasia esculenta]|uniref:RING-type E3 ubiquitin transferase n=1 Tax=Colocasia esculenta TaxID=4460 RepID=A0A843WNW5_COLES|nr:hypothetical protein [Colocasia esculenta]